MTVHLQQTKRGSRATGGPQYYFHDVPEPLKLFLRKKGAVRVALLTPYGATKSDYFAVSDRHKLAVSGDVVPGRVGHDRIQQGRAGESIGESIRRWYRLPAGDFERIDVDVAVRDDVFYLTPLRYKQPHRTKARDIPNFRAPLSFTEEFQSQFWKEHIRNVERNDTRGPAWSLDEICRVVVDHLKASRVAHVQEPDLLRAAGALSRLGVRLGPYVGKGYDCLTKFQFLSFPEYEVPVELKRHSSGFSYQERKYGRDELSRAVILCAVHDHKRLPDHIDVIELRALCQLGKSILS